MALTSAPQCACGEAMFEMATPGYFECAHCDGPCHSRCADECEQSGNGKCARCNGLDIGTRPKKDRSWVPPKAA